MTFYSCETNIRRSSISALPGYDVKDVTEGDLDEIRDDEDDIPISQLSGKTNNGNQGEN